MLRVLRRDIRWHDSRRLFPGQFVQFETVEHDEVPINPNDEREAPFALRVRSPEIRFSLVDSYDSHEERHQQGGRYEVEGRYQGYGGGYTRRQITDASESMPRNMNRGSMTKVADRPEAISLPFRMPVESGRPEESSRRHPILARWTEGSTEMASRAESPAWLWEPALAYFKDESIEMAPIIPLQIRNRPKKKKNIQIMMHEYAVERGLSWQEPAFRAGREEAMKLQGPKRKVVEKISLRLWFERNRAKMKMRRQWQARIAEYQLRQNGVISTLD